jgi:hypothetical protein
MEKITRNQQSIEMETGSEILESETTDPIEAETADLNEAEAAEVNEAEAADLNEAEAAEVNEAEAAEINEAETAEEDEAEAGDDATQNVEGKENEEISSAQKRVHRNPTAAASKTQKRRNTSKLAFSVVLIAAGIVVLLSHSNQWSLQWKREIQPAPVQEKKAVSITPPVSTNKSMQADPHADYRTRLSEIGKLRESLILKNREIRTLKEHYAKGIEKLEKDILQEILSDKVQNYQQALQNKRIELGLQTIQRRLGYIKKLDDPIHWLEQGSEELLYIKRKTNFDLQLIEIASGIDMDLHMRHINAAIRKYRLTADNLAINTEGLKLEPLENIFKRLYSKTVNAPHLQAELDNWYIQQEICSGDLSRVGELSDISIDAAKCMSETKISDLFLNNITELSPRVTKYLCQWDGKWLCLNGVEVLSPSVAEYLFQWKGEWISLNGLTDFPPELAKYLIQWKGKQLELMGLNLKEQKTQQLSLKYMVEWEKAGGKLFVPEPIRNMMKQL